MYMIVDCRWNDWNRPLQYYRPWLTTHSTSASAVTLIKDLLNHCCQ